MMVKGGAGLLAGVLAGGLGFAFWPRVEPGVLSLRPAVEKPVFVVATEPARPVSAPSTALVAAPAEPRGDKNGLVKLAAALRSDPAPPASAAPLGRGLAEAALKTGAPSEAACWRNVTTPAASRSLSPTWLPISTPTWPAAMERSSSAHAASGSCNGTWHIGSSRPCAGAQISSARSFMIRAMRTACVAPAA